MAHEPTHKGVSKIQGTSKEHSEAVTGHTMKPKPRPIPKGALGSGTAEGAAEAIRKHKKMLDEL